MQPAEEPDDFLPSPGAHHSFLPQAGRQALRRGGRRAEGQVGLCAGSMQGWLVPQTPAQALARVLWDKGSSRATADPHSSQRGEGIQGALKEGAAAPHQASSLGPLCPFSLLAQPVLWGRSVLEGRTVSSQAWSKLCPAGRWRWPPCSLSCRASCCCRSWPFC